MYAALSHMRKAMESGGEAGETELKLYAALDEKLAELTAQMEAIEVRKSAQALRAIWVLGNEYLQEAAPWTAIKTDEARAAVVVRTALNLVALIARISAPMIPFTAQKIAAAVGEAWPPTWPADGAKAELARLEPGRSFSVPEVLFKKIEDTDVAEWAARFGGQP